MSADFGSRIKKRWKQEEQHKRYQRRKIAKLHQQMMVVRGGLGNITTSSKRLSTTNDLEAQQGVEDRIDENCFEGDAFCNDNDLMFDDINALTFDNDETSSGSILDDYGNITQTLADDPLMTLAAVADLSIAEHHEISIAPITPPLKEDPQNDENGDTVIIDIEEEMKREEQMFAPIANRAVLLEMPQSEEAENSTSVEAVQQLEALEDEIELRNVMSNGIDRLEATRRRLKTGEISLPPPRAGGIGEVISLNLAGLSQIAIDYHRSPLLFSVIHSNRGYMYGKQFPGGKDANCFGRLVTHLLQKLDGLLSGGEKRSSIYGKWLTYVCLLTRTCHSLLKCYQMLTSPSCLVYSGERTTGGLFDIIAVFEALGVPLNKTSKVVDFGSGRGVPNIIFALFAGMSLGIEHDKLRFQVSSCLPTFDIMSTLTTLIFFRHVFCFLRFTIPKQSLNGLVWLVKHYPDVLPKANCFFIEKDINELKSIEGITHAYSFECGMPKNTLVRMASVANDCHSLQVLVCSNPHMKQYGLKNFILHPGSLSTSLAGMLFIYAILVPRLYEFDPSVTLLCTAVVGSGENRQTFFYVKKELFYEEIDTTMDRLIAATMNTGASTPDDAISKAFDIMEGGEKSILQAACRLLSVKGGLWSTERTLRSSSPDDDNFLDDQFQEDDEDADDYSLYTDFCRLHVPGRNDDSSVLRGKIENRRATSTEEAPRAYMSSSATTNKETMLVVFSLLIDLFEAEFHGNNIPKSYLTARDAAKMITVVAQLVSNDEGFQFKVGTVKAKLKAWFFRHVTRNLLGPSHSYTTVNRELKAIEAFHMQVAQTDEDIEFQTSLYLRSSFFFSMKWIPAVSWKRYYVNPRGRKYPSSFN
jgi:hypothetical protein